MPRLPKHAVRILFERILGKSAMAYLLHLRPAEWPIVTAHMLLGTFLAVGARVPWKLAALGWLSFVLLLNGGTLAINSAFDQDEGDIGYLKDPPKPPKHLLAFSILLLLGALLLSMRFIAVAPKGRYFFEIVMTCVLMSVLYSVPPIRLKARAGWDLVINCVGFGFFTPLAGWSLTGLQYTKPILSAAVGFLVLFAALYPLTQIYQVEEDSARGDHTLVIWMGVGRSLKFALGCALVAHLWFAQAAVQMHRSPLPLLISLVAWLGLLFPWWRQWRTWTPQKAEAGMYKALAIWAVTDVSLLILLWPRP